MAIIGLGKRGRQHLDIAMRHKLFNSIVLVDINEQVKNSVSLPFFSNHKMIPDNVNVAIIATPTTTHYRIARDLITRGIHILLEKPPTNAVRELHNLVNLAREKKIVLKIGYSERFSSAIEIAKRNLPSNQVSYIEAYRLSPFPARSTDVDVVKDLMIHDIDITLTLLQELPVRIHAIGIPVVTRLADIAKVIFFFRNGSEAHLTCSRISDKRYRKFRIFTKETLTSIDMISKEVQVYRRKKMEVNDISPASIQTDMQDMSKIIDLQTYNYSSEDNIYNEHKAFIEQINKKQIDLEPMSVASFEVTQAVSNKIKKFLRKI